jgi:DNA-directed RNA polymerase specialized sigma subunit
MIGLLNQMASYAYGDVQRHEASQPVTVEEIEDYRQPHTDSAISTILDRAEVDQLMSVLSERERLIIERELADVPDSEVAAELEIESNNLHQIRWRALKRMREAAGQQEWGS